MNIKKLLNDDEFCRDCNSFISGRCVRSGSYCSMYDMFNSLREDYIDLKLKFEQELMYKGEW